MVELPLTTSRLLLRNLNYGDVLMYQYALNCREVAENMSINVGWPVSSMVAVDLIRGFLDDVKNGTARHFVLDLDEKNRHIGMISLRSCLEWVEVGFYLEEKFRSRGYMSEAMEVVSCYCLDELGTPKVRGRVRNENVAARKVFERCRYSFVQSENDCFLNPFGENVSCDYWEISRDL